jgi:hypothetical protein
MLLMRDLGAHRAAYPGQSKCSVYGIVYEMNIIHRKETMPECPSAHPKECYADTVMEPMSRWTKGI